MKTCTRCGESKSRSEYHSHKGHKDGLSSQCKPCRNMSAEAYGKTKRGLVTRMYTNQNSHGLKRGQSRPDYTLDELHKWVNGNGFEEMYDVWVESGYDTRLTPSCDRLDDHVSYTFDNMRLITWEENREKGYQTKKDGRGLFGDNLRPVRQLSLDGEFVTSFRSQSEAERETGIKQGNISMCCLGNALTAGGYTWEFVE